jgi:hypothetical protein
MTSKTVPAGFNVTTILSDSTPFLGGDIPLIKFKTDALPTLTETGGTATTNGAAEVTVYTNVAGTLFTPKHIDINFVNQTAAEAVVIKYYKVNVTGGASTLFDSKTYVGLVVPNMRTITMDDNRFGVTVTITKTAGNNQNYVWEAFYE